MRYDIIEKIGEGNRGEVYKIRLEDGSFAALKWAKSYKIDKEWDILIHLNGKYSPKPLFRGKRFFVMELIEGVSLKELKGKEYYTLLKEALKGAYNLDKLGVFHKQLGRYNHIYKTSSGVKFIDFERAVFREIPRNFLQILGYYLRQDKNFDKNEIEMIAKVYKSEKEKALRLVFGLIDEVIKEKRWQ